LREKNLGFVRRGPEVRRVEGCWDVGGSWGCGRVYVKGMRRLGRLNG